MSAHSRSKAGGSGEGKLLEVLVAGTSGETGLPFFRALVRGLCDALGTHGAWVTEYLPETRRLKAIACRFGGEWIPDYQYDIGGTPCEACIENRGVLVVADRVADLFPGDNDLGSIGAASFMGTAFFDESGRHLLGHLAILDLKPIPDPDRFQQVFRIFANRAGAELRRWNLEKELRSRTEELDAIFDSAMDAILILDEEHAIVCANPAAEAALGTGRMEGEMIDRFLSVQGAGKLEPMLQKLLTDPPGEGSRLWIPGGVEARSSTGETFAVEGTLSRFDLKGRPFATLILRNVSARLEAEARLHNLTEQSAYLREEIEHAFGEIVGDSPPMRHLAGEIRRVARTDVSVLISGETGAGKELIARAVHRASRRAQAPLIKVNCAAIPEQLIESEFFGHEKGAFTGALARREGRFSLANGGTLFLDEIGELPLALQSKLLRVLQEGEFEPVGSSRTVRVDVRVIAATNRDLDTEVKAGRFREDLYYRLNVFPLQVPPLRARAGDIGPLANEFVARFCARNGQPPILLTDDDLRRLRSYPWPGNVRELSNVIERAMITGDGQRLNLDRALPEADADGPDDSGSAARDRPPDPGRVFTAAEMESMQRENFRRALRLAGGKISGPGGAAEMLGLKPTTLRSRLAALGITGKYAIPSEEVTESRH